MSRDAARMSACATSFLVRRETISLQNSAALGREQECAEGLRSFRILGPLQYRAALPDAGIRVARHLPIVALAGGARGDRQRKRYDAHFRRAALRHLARLRDV